MRVTYDHLVDAAYVYLVDQIGPGQVKRTVHAADINLDFDGEGRLIGIELLRGSLLPAKLMEAAEKIGGRTS